MSSPPDVSRNKIRHILKSKDLKQEETKHCSKGEELSRLRAARVLVTQDVVHLQFSTGTSGLYVHTPVCLVDLCVSESFPPTSELPL